MFKSLIILAVIIIIFLMSFESSKWSSVMCSPQLIPLFVLKVKQILFFSHAIVAYSCGFRNSDCVCVLLTTWSTPHPRHSVQAVAQRGREWERVTVPKSHTRCWVPGLQGWHGLRDHLAPRPPAAPPVSAAPGFRGTPSSKCKAVHSISGQLFLNFLNWRHFGTFI